MQEIRQKLTDMLVVKGSHLLGCRRRNAWDGDTAPAWRWLRGNALLALVGTLDRFDDDDLGLFSCFMWKSQILQFRGGPWNLGWVHDFQEIWSLIKYNYSDVSKDIIVLHEDKGQLDIKTISILDALDWKSVRQKVLDDLSSDPVGRIHKNTPRALKICRHCPHKQRCDAFDQLHNDTTDWHPKYPQP